MVCITIYDGSHTIGGNKIYIEDNESGLFLDFGMNFAKYQEFFEEFLSERNTRGIHDLIHLNLLPKLNIYRTDLIPADLSMNIYPKLEVKAVLLSHAHLDHCGNIGLLNKTIPVVASPISISILKAMRDISQSRMGSEIFYYATRTPCDDRKLVLKSDRNRIGREFISTVSYPAELDKFTSEISRQDASNSKPGTLGNLQELKSPFAIEAYDVDHSIYGATAYILRGDVTLAYTGDFRFHGKNSSKTRDFINKAKDISILIIEGTRVERADVNESEEVVFQNCLHAVEESKKLVIADFSPRNFERLEIFERIAEKTGRQLIVTAKDIYMLYGIECAGGGTCPIKNISIYDELRVNRGKWETNIIKKNWGNNYVDYTTISKNPEKYLLCFSFFDLKHLLDIKPDGGTYIYSSSEAFSEEQEFDFRRLWKWLDFFKFTICGFEMIPNHGELQPHFIRGYHASGHASKSEIEQVIDTIDPDKIIPVHTSQPHWFQDNFDNVLLAQEGVKIKI